MKRHIEVNRSQVLPLVIHKVTNCWQPLRKNDTALLRKAVGELVNSKMSTKKACSKYRLCINPLHQKDRSETEWNSYLWLAKTMKEVCG